MKSYICAILLLMCGTAYSATQIRGGCLFDRTILGVGAHTLYPCIRMICDPNGQITFLSCPKIECNRGMDVVGYRPETNDRPYPHCCPQPLCKGRLTYPNEPYALS